MHVGKVKTHIFNMASSRSELNKIRIKTARDLPGLYGVIEDYAQYFSHTTAITEFVFRYGIQRETYLRKTERPAEWKAAEAARELPDASSPLWSAVRRVGLATDEEKRWVKILSWMSPGVLVARNKALHELGNRYEVESWITHQDSVFAQYAAATLLVLCPDIETLVLEDNDIGVRGPVCQVLRRNNKSELPQPCLQKLKKVRFLPTSDLFLGDERYYIRMDVLQLLGLFHRLPALESIGVDAVSPSNDAGYEESFPCASSAIKRIRMRHVSLPNTVIEALIRAPRALEEFTCTSGGRASEGGGFWSVFPEIVGKALWCQRRTLRKLDLDWDQYLGVPYRRKLEERPDEEVEEEEEEPGWEMVHSVKTADLENGKTYDSTIGSLHDFERLTHVSIGVQWLFGRKEYGKELPDAPFRLIDALPRSLKYLMIRGYRRGDQAKYDEQIDELMALKESRLPNLRTIEGVDQLVPSGRNVRYPDQNPDQLWRPDAVEDEW